MNKIQDASSDGVQVDVKSQVISDLRQAMVSLQNAYNRAVKAQPICGDVAVFVKIQGMSKELNGVMIDVNKLRGL